MLRGGSVIRVCTAFQDTLDNERGPTGAEVLKRCIVPDKTVFKNILEARVGGSEDGEEVREIG